MMVEGGPFVGTLTSEYFWVRATFMVALMYGFAFFSRRRGQF